MSQEETIAQLLALLSCVRRCWAAGEQQAAHDWYNVFCRAWLFAKDRVPEGSKNDGGIRTSLWETQELIGAVSK